MKSSNKILIVFFGVILLYISAAFTEVRVRGVKGDLSDESAKVETLALNNLKYVIVSNLDKRVLIKSSDEPRLEIRRRSEGILSKLNYELKGDTLQLNELTVEEDVRFNLTLHVPQGLLGIQTEDASVHISDFKQAGLTVIQAGGRIVFNRNIDLGKLSIKATNDADFDAYSFDIDSVLIEMNDSEVYMESPVSSLKGEMKNKSTLVMGSVNDIVFNKDESSELRLFN